MRADFLEGVSVSVRADGQDLHEYESDTTGLETAKTATAYIEAKPDSNFAIEIRLTSAFPYTKDHLTCNMFLDGKWVRGKVANLSVRGTVMSMDGSLEMVNGISAKRRFAFAEHDMSKFLTYLSRILSTALTKDVVDGSVKASDKDKFTKLGEVTVTLTRSREIGTNKNDHKTPFDAAAEKGIPEKALKGRAIGAHAKSVPHPDLCCKKAAES